MDWFPWYFLLYEADTMHLTPYQDGCYRRLIDHYMKTRQSLPDNDAALARIIGDTEANWVAMASAIVRPFFTPKKGRLFLQKCEEQLLVQEMKTKKQSESGKNGAKKRWNKNKDLDGNPMGTPLGFDSTRQEQDKTGQKKEDVVAIGGSKKTVFELGEEIAEIVGWKDDPRWTGNYSRLAAWIEKGWSFDLDILPTVKQIMAKKTGQPPKTLNYFEGAIADANATRLRPLPEGTAKQNKSSGRYNQGQKESYMDKMFNAAQRACDEIDRELDATGMGDAHISGQGEIAAGVPRRITHQQNRNVEEVAGSENQHIHGEIDDWNKC